MEEWIGLVFFFGLFTALLGGYVAKQKNRSLVEGAILGFLFSLIGVIILALLPNQDASKKKKTEIDLPFVDFLAALVIILCAIALISTYLF